jgi:nickel-dependent lactate racemase
MRLGLDFGRDHIDVEVRDASRVALHQAPHAPALADAREAMRTALEQPLRFEPLRRALTPEDHIAVVIDERLPQLAPLLTGLLEHIASARVPPEAVTLVSPPPATRQGWLDDLPDEFQDVRVEVHDPDNRQRLAYLASTKQGRRIYLNRSAVDADQLIVLSGRRYDPLLGYAGAEGAVYPALSDRETLSAMADRLSPEVPGGAAWPVRLEAEEVAWLLGAPFLVQVIEGAGDGIQQVVAGLADTSADGRRLLDQRWRGEVGEPADTVVATLSGDPHRHDFADLAHAAACAARVVRPDGRIVLLTQAEPSLGEGADLLRQTDDAEEALRLLRERKPADLAAALEWAEAARKARLFLLSGLPDATAEELFATPLEHARQVQRLLDAEGTWLVVPDAHKALVVPAT